MRALLHYIELQIIENAVKLLMSKKARWSRKLLLDACEILKIKSSINIFNEFYRRAYSF